MNNAAGQNTGLIGDLLNFRLSGIQKVSQDYINQFFTIGQIQNMINDAQAQKLSEKEKSLLAYLGLGSALELLEHRDKECLTEDDEHHSDQSSKAAIVSIDKSNAFKAIDNVFCINRKDPDGSPLRYEPSPQNKAGNKNTIVKSVRENRKQFSLQMQETEGKLIQSLDNPFDFGTREDESEVPPFTDQLRNQVTGFSTDERFVEKLMQQDYNIGDRLD